MAAKVGVSRSTVNRVWRAFGLQPHRSETFKLSTDPLFIDKVRDIVGLYMSPPANAVVLSVDEKSQIQALLILDNYGTHKTPSVKAWLARHPRFHVHFTPTSASWLNQVERWFALLTQKQIKRGSHRSTIELERAIREYLDIYNEQPQPFIWTKSADDILASIVRFCERISESRH